MPVPVNKHVHGHSDAGTALRTVQAASGQPISVSGIDTPQALEREIIRMQIALSLVSATNPPSNKKFDPAKINKSIDDQMLSAKLAELQVAANLT
jgi:hypothetical protein